MDVLPETVSGCKAVPQETDGSPGVQSVGMTFHICSDLPGYMQAYYVY